MASLTQCGHNVLMSLERLTSTFFLCHNRFVHFVASVRFSVEPVLKVDNERYYAREFLHTAIF